MVSNNSDLYKDGRGVGGLGLKDSYYGGELVGGGSADRGLGDETLALLLGWGIVDTQILQEGDPYKHMLDDYAFIRK